MISRFALAWLLGNILLAVFFVEIWWGLFLVWLLPLIAAWIVTLLLVLTREIGRPTTAPSSADQMGRRTVTRRRLSVAMILAGVVIAWFAPTLGDYCYVLRNEDRFLGEIRKRFLAPTDSDASSDWIVDPPNGSPMRAAKFLFAAHGDVNGIVYDPTGEVWKRADTWLFGAATRHIYGPWYSFAN